jgi:hypothetical protein
VSGVAHSREQLLEDRGVLAAEVEAAEEIVHDLDRGDVPQPVPLRERRPLARALDPACDLPAAVAGPVGPDPLGLRPQIDEMLVGPLIGEESRCGRGERLAAPGRSGSSLRNPQQRREHGAHDVRIGREAEQRVEGLQGREARDPDRLRRLRAGRAEREGGEPAGLEETAPVHAVRH